MRDYPAVETPKTMTCPSCSSYSVVPRSGLTALGYRRFRCKDCRSRFNERSGTPFNYLEFPTDVVMLVVLWRLRYKLSLRDLAEMFLERGLVFTHEAVRDWEGRFAPLIADELRRRRRGRVGSRWSIDETYVKIAGKWCYLYRAIDEYGDLVDCLLSRKRDMKAAKAFLRSALEVAGKPPKQATTDGHGAYPRAIKEELGHDVQHRTGKHLNDTIEQDHRGIKQRYYPMRGFGAFASATRFCRAFDELKNFFRPLASHNEKVSLSTRRRIHVDRFASLLAALSLA